MAEKKQYTVRLEFVGFGFTSVEAENEKEALYLAEQEFSYDDFTEWSVTDTKIDTEND